MKKKLMALLLTAVMLCSMLALPAQAAQYKVGDAIGNVLYTDIVTYIDGYAIRSYNINGYTYIVAEDLLMYGFSVVWNGAAKTLKKGAVVLDCSSINPIASREIASELEKLSHL